MNELVKQPLLSLQILLAERVFIPLEDLGHRKRRRPSWQA